MYSGPDRCSNNEKDIWFKFGNIMWRKHRSILQEHIKYIHNYIVNNFWVGILHYAENVRKIHDLTKYLPPTSMKGREYDQADWNIHNKELNEDLICVATNDGLPTSMEYE